MTDERPVFALIYDFDKTLCTTDMQEFGLIPKLGMSSAEFWGKTNEMSKGNRMDSILAYMYQILKQSERNDCSIKRQDFVDAGRDVRFFPGVEEWFDLINELGEKIGLKVEHYVISSGLKETIEGTPISDRFEKVFACEYYYDVNGIAVWPKSAVNYTDKTQALFRINKGILDESDSKSLNMFMLDEERRVPFPNMVYIGDGLTDVPCMKLVKDHGGKSIAVYDEDRSVAEGLMNAGRIDFICTADYREGGELYETVREIMHWVLHNSRLTRQSLRDRRTAGGDIDETEI